MLAKYFRGVRQKCWEIIEREYPEEKDKYAITQGLVAKSLKDNCILLDAGSGHWSNFPEVSHLKGIKIGIDKIPDDIRKNKSIDIRLCADINCIPLKSESVDIIICNMVFEHLEKPETNFSELSRVLKKDGHLIFMTPCIYNIVTIISRILPDHFHKKLAKLLTCTSESDTFRTFYRANSVGRLRRMLYKNNLIEKDLIMYQPPPYAFVFSIRICKIIIHYYHFINRYNFLRFLRGVIISRYQKI